MRQQAKSTATWHSGCPGSVALGSLATGTVVFVEGSVACTTSASGNAASNPVIFIVRDGSFSLGGNAKFFGLVYVLNASNQTNAKVTLSGCAKIQGMIAVDGLGGVDVGSCKQNLTYDPSILGSLRTYGGAVMAKNSFRVLPGQRALGARRARAVAARLAHDPAAARARDRPHDDRAAAAPAQVDDARRAARAPRRTRTRRPPTVTRARASRAPRRRIVKRRRLAHGARRPGPRPAPPRPAGPGTRRRRRSRHVRPPANRSVG